MRRIAVIGNAGGGKTALSRLLGDMLALPVYHVDSIQYRPGWERTPLPECDRRLDELAAEKHWVIDGFGSDDVIERRMRAADTVVFVDFPLVIHYWWACKRQWRSRRQQRAELPEDCPEFTLEYSWKLATEMWRVHRCYRPWFTEMVKALPDDIAIIHIRNPREWKSFADRAIEYADREPERTEHREST